MKEKKKAGKPISTKFVLSSDSERLRKDIFRTDIEKFKLFTRMLRTNSLFRKAVVTHK